MKINFMKRRGESTMHEVVFLFGALFLLALFIFGGSFRPVEIKKRLLEEKALELPAQKLVLQGQNTQFEVYLGASPSAPKIYTIRNEGTQNSPLLMGNVKIIGPNANFFRIGANDCEDILSPGAFCSLEIRLDTNTNGVFNAEIAVVLEDKVVSKIPLLGVASGFTGRLEWSGLKIWDLSNRTPGVVLAIERDYELRNIGGGQVPNPQNEIRIEGRGFSIVNHSCNFPLNQGTSCRAKIRWTNQGAFDTKATLYAPRTSFEINVTAPGITPKLEWLASDKIKAPFDMVLQNTGTLRTRNTPDFNILMGAEHFTLNTDECRTFLEGSSSCDIKLVPRHNRKGEYPIQIQVKDYNAPVYRGIIVIE